MGFRRNNRAATYFRQGRGESWGSIQAKEEGRFPLSYFATGSKAQAIKEVAEIYGWTPTEYHHTGKYAVETIFWSQETVNRCLAVLKTTGKPFTKAVAAIVQKRLTRSGRAFQK